MSDTQLELPTMTRTCFDNENQISFLILLTLSHWSWRLNLVFLFSLYFFCHDETAVTPPSVFLYVSHSFSN